MSNHFIQELEKIEVPEGIHERGVAGVKKAKREVKAKGYIRKRIISGVLAVAILVPTSAFAYQTLLADELYGSFENLQKYVASVTMDGYLLFEAKLSQAKGELSKEEFQEFKRLLKVLTAAKMEFGDRYGNIDYSQVPSEQLDTIRHTLFAIQPYFDQLNGVKSSKEVLTAEEYEAYIEALMSYEDILVKSNNDIHSIPAPLQDDFQQISTFLDYVNDKQLDD